MKKIIKLVVVLIIFLSCFEAISINSYASDNTIDYVYLKTKKEESKKVYVSEEIASIIRKTDVEINDEETSSGWWIFKKTEHKYSYETRNYVQAIVDYRIIDDSIDTMVYMMEQLAKYANEYRGYPDEKLRGKCQSYLLIMF